MTPTAFDDTRECLNPYSNGILSEPILRPSCRERYCLNPYSNGILSENNAVPWWNFCRTVLILILMEYSLRMTAKIANATKKSLNPYSNGILSETNNELLEMLVICLNPYSNGILSESRCLWTYWRWRWSLNPYSNGILSETQELTEVTKDGIVLILILMEYSLRVCTL